MFPKLVADILSGSISPVYWPPHAVRSGAAWRARRSKRIDAEAAERCAESAEFRHARRVWARRASPDEFRLADRGSLRTARRPQHLNRRQSGVRRCRVKPGCDRLGRKEGETAPVVIGLPAGCVHPPVVERPQPARWRPSTPAPDDATFARITYGPAAKMPSAHIRSRGAGTVTVQCRAGPARRASRRPDGAGLPSPDIGDLTECRAMQFCGSPDFHRREKREGSRGSPGQAR